MQTAPDQEAVASRAGAAARARRVGRMRRAAQLAAGLGCVGMLAWAVDWRASLALLARAAPAEAALVAGLAALGIAVCALKWQRLLAALSVAAPLGGLLRIYWASAFVGTFLPSTLPGDAARVVLARPFGDAATVAASIAAERATGLATLVLLAAGGALARPDLLPDGLSGPGVLAAAAGVLLLLALAPLVPTRLVPARLRWRPRGGGAAALGRFGTALAGIGRHPGALQAAVAFSAAFYAVVVLSHWAALRALGADPHLADVAAVALLVAFVAGLPISPNGLGVGEAAFVLLYGQIGVAPEQALAAALLRRALVTLVALAGAVPWLASRGRAAAAPGAGKGAATPADAPGLLIASRPRVPVLAHLLDDLPLRPRRFGPYLAGCVCFSLGVTCLTAADLGIDPLHAMAIAIVDAVGLPHVQVGLVVSTATVAMLAVWAAWVRRLPPASVFVTMALTAYLVDAWRLLAADAWLTDALPSSALMLLGLALDAYGSALIIMSGVGIRVVDLVALALVERLGWRFMAGKVLVEAGFVVVAWLLAGPLGAATLAFLMLVGPFMEPMMWASARYLGLPNHGLRRATSHRAPARQGG